MKTMTINTAKQLAKQLMGQHGLLSEWQFKIGRGTRTCGSCCQKVNRLTGEITEQYISISRHHIEHNTEEIVRDTILHEIAHAIAGPAAGHNTEWKVACMQVGARPERMAGDEVIAVKGWVADCTCGHKHERYGKPRIPRRCRRSKQDLIYYKKA